MNEPLQIPAIRTTLGYLILLMILVSCSENEQTDNNKTGHSHPQATDMEKHLFEHEFAQQCISQKSANADNKAVARERFAEPCLCIATYLLKDLAAKESYSLLYDQKHSDFFETKYEQAVEQCW